MGVHPVGLRNLVIAEISLYVVFSCTRDVSALKPYYQGLVRKECLLDGSAHIEVVVGQLHVLRISLVVEDATQFDLSAVLEPEGVESLGYKQRLVVELCFAETAFLTCIGGIYGEPLLLDTESIVE